MRYFNTLIVLSILFVCSMPVNAQSPVLLYYYERIPYAVADNQGEVSGLCATTAAKTFRKEGLRNRLVQKPGTRGIRPFHGFNLSGQTGNYHQQKRQPGA